MLALKVCDPAMGSGAFLVEACRQLGARLVRGLDALARDTPPKYPTTRMRSCTRAAWWRSAASTASTRTRARSSSRKLSLWLATLARDHEFTFLDHALKAGDSLVGLTTEQIAAIALGLVEAGPAAVPQVRRRTRVAEATEGRARNPGGAGGHDARDARGQASSGRRAWSSDVRMMGDAVISAFFAEDKPKAREKRRATIESLVAGSQVKWDELGAPRRACGG